MVFRMITPQEVLDVKRLVIVEQYIDQELKKCNFGIKLNQFKEILNLDDVDLLIEKYKDVGWEVDDISSLLSFRNLFC
nr:MAG TPA: UBA-like domain protein [Caudoviricetes sp.]